MSKLRSDLILIIAAIIWGFAFVAQRLGMENVGPFTFTAVRFTLGSLVLVPVLAYRKKTINAQARLIKQNRKIFWLILLLGIILFGGISFQQYGLQFTTAGNAGFITGFYVVLVPLAGFCMGRKTTTRIWAGVILAISGLYFLSVKKELSINPGDYYVVVCALFWTVHVLLVGYLAPRTDPVLTAVIQFLICSVLSWVVAAAVEEIRLDAITRAAWPILYGGIMSVGLAYTLQVIAQQKAHPAYASVLLSLESVFAVIGGWLILDEHLTLRALSGCILMLAGMVIVQIQSSGRTIPLN